MDNARVHHSQEIVNLVEAYGKLLVVLFNCTHHNSSGCRIEYLPPYSPDYNPIEQAFSVIKAHLHHNGIGFFEANALYYELYRACKIITPEMMWGFFSHAGYL